MGRVRSVLTIVSVSLVAAASYGQSEGCSCRDYLSDKLRSADTIIQVNDQFRLAVCGYYNKHNRHFSEFTIYECGRSISSLYEWGAIKECTMFHTDSSLVVDELAVVPQGGDLVLQSVPCWRMEFVRSEGADGDVTVAVIRSMVVKLPKPTSTQVYRFEAQYKTTSHPDEDLLGHLFLCAAYDANGWRERFKALRETGKLDGAVAEYFTELAALLEEIQEPLH